MAGLESLTGDDPLGSESPTQGDNRIRELTQKTKESVSKEHTLSGIHAILSGTGTARPAAGNEGRFYILTESGVAKELQYDNGSSWESITKNQDVIDQIADLSTHINSNPINHADASIERDHLGTGILAKKHFGQAFINDNNAVVKLINGSELDSTWHTHPQTEFTSDGRPTFISIVSLAQNSSVLGDPAVQKTITLDSGDIPLGAVAVILEAVGNISVKNLNTNVLYHPKIKIRGRYSDGSETEWMLLIGGSLAYVGTWDYGVYAMGWRGQGTFPITTSGGSARKFDYLVNDFNGIDGDTGWEIRVVGYI